MTTTERLFEQADAARRSELNERGMDELGSDDDGSAIFTNAPFPIRRGKPTYFAQANGDVHVCFGVNCPYVSLTKESDYVCSISGVVQSKEQAKESDASWTGRSVGSSNPDDSSGTPAGGWSKRRDMLAASIAAYRNAHTISDDIVVATAPAPAAPTPIKRGALCVDEAPEEATPKRQRQSKRGAWTRDAVEKLTSEAASTISKLFVVKNEIKKLDPRLQNVDFVRRLYLMKYIRQCREGQQLFNLCAVNCALIGANEFVRKQREEAREQERIASDFSTAASHRVRTVIARLIVSVWHAACSTPFLRGVGRSSDSFRPFVAGALYSLKRGVYLDTGQCIIPKCPGLAANLPALRSSFSTPTAKALQSSSHRGICCLHRAIASIPELEGVDRVACLRLFSDASMHAETLARTVNP